MKQLLKLRRILFLAVCILLLTHSQAYADDAKEYAVGNNIQATLKNGVLTLSGAGEMTGYSKNYAPWEEDKESIKSVVIGEGITSVGRYAFFECSKLTSVQLPETLEYINNYAFQGCGLTKVQLPYRVYRIYAYAFADNANLSLISLPGGILSIDYNAFSNDEKLTIAATAGSVGETFAKNNSIPLNTQALLPCKELKLNMNKLSLRKSKQDSLTASISPIYSTDMISFASSNTEVASVYGSQWTYKTTVTAVGEGSTSISVTAGNKSAACQVTVVDGYYDIHLYDRVFKFDVLGFETPLSYYTIPSSGIKDTKVNWKSEDPSVATVDQEGNVTSVGNGKTRIVAYSTDEVVKAYCFITVDAPVKVEAINLSDTNLVMTEQIYNLTYTTTPEKEDVEVLWSSSDEKVLKVNEKGELKAVSDGTAVITATLAENEEITATCNVTVSCNTKLPITAIALNKTELSLASGAVEELIATIAPAIDQTDRLGWKSSNIQVAKVGDGKVRAIAKGECEITCYSLDDKNIKAVCKVLVDGGNYVPQPPQPEAVAAPEPAPVEAAPTVPNVKLKKLEAGVGSLKVSWKKAKDVTYEVQYSLDKKFAKKKTKTVKIKDKKMTSVGITKLKSGKTYYCRIRGILKSGKKTYPGKWSKSLSKKVQ